MSADEGAMRLALEGLLVLLELALLGLELGLAAVEELLQRGRDAQALLRLEHRAAVALAAIGRLANERLLAKRVDEVADVLVSYLDHERSRVSFESSAKH